MGEDEITRTNSKDGMYTAKSGYWLAMIERVEDAKNYMKDGDIRKTTWGLNVPRIVRDFIRSACKEVIPCKTKLA